MTDKEVVLCFLDAETGARSEPIRVVPLELVDRICALDEERYAKVSKDFVFVLMDQVTGEWAYSKAPVMGVPTFINLFAQQATADPEVSNG